MVGRFGAVPRAAVVLGAFVAASAAAVAVLWAAGPSGRALDLRTAVAVPEAPSGAIVGAGMEESPRIAPRIAAPARGRWQAIVIHDSGTPAGDLASLERRHSRAGLAGLGHHFVIGNGQGMDDGQVAIGYRWDHQLPGAHAAAGMALSCAGAPALDAAALNQGAIAVCIVGNVGRRAPTDAQVAALVSLVRSLQAEFGIRGDRVRFRSELGASGGAAGEFPLAFMRERILP